MFFSFEGIDGSGKSTQARLLAEELRAAGHEVVEVREPGGTSLGEAIRSLLLEPKRQIDERAELLLFSAARAQLVAEVIEPALSRSAVVIADRFYDSSTAYQGGGRQLADTDWMTRLHRFATQSRSPDRTFLIDVPLVLAAQRRGERAQDRMEQGGDEFYSRVRASYLGLEGDRVVVLDGRQSIEHLRQTIAAEAHGLLSKPHH